MIEKIVKMLHLMEDQKRFIRHIFTFVIKYNIPKGFDFSICYEDDEAIFSWETETTSIDLIITKEDYFRVYIKTPMKKLHKVMKLHEFDLTQKRLTKMFNRVVT